MDYDHNPKAKQGNNAITIFLLTLVVLLGERLAFFKQQGQLATKSATPASPLPTP